jgi:hypothetical protein
MSEQATNTFLIWKLEFSEHESVVVKDVSSMGAAAHSVWSSALTAPGGCRPPAPHTSIPLFPERSDEFLERRGVDRGELEPG